MVPCEQDRASVGTHDAAENYGNVRQPPCHAHAGEMVRVSRPGSVLEGQALGVDRDGALRIRGVDGFEHRVTTGEVEA